MKKCSKCQIEKEISNFHKNRSKKDGLNHYCIICTKAKSKKYHIKNREKNNKRSKQWKEDNKEHVKLYGKLNQRKYYKRSREYKNTYRKENVDKIKESRALFYENNKDRVKANVAQWQRENPSLVNSYNAKRRARKIKATPKWLTTDDIKEMQDIYKKAKEISKKTGVEHQVDHIHPLKGVISLGLHVPWNLQILTKEENCKKSNSLIERC